MSANPLNGLDRRTVVSRARLERLEFIVNRLANSHPLYGVSRYGDIDYVCFFCGEDEYLPHKDDCIWLLAGGKL